MNDRFSECGQEPTGCGHGAKVRMAVSAVCGVLLLAGAQSRAANEVENWNVVAANAGAAAGQHPAIQPRTYAIMHLAIHDALNAIDRRYTPYLLEESTSREASASAAVAAAARGTLVALLPNQEQPVQAAYTAALAAIPEGASKAAGVQIGQRAAALIVARRSTDGWNSTAVWNAGTMPGQYRPTPPGNAQAQLPHWGNVTPFTYGEKTQFRSAPPPDLLSPEYAKAVQEIKLIGSDDSELRTPLQSEIARYWYEATVQGWNRIARVTAGTRNLDLWETARLYALLNTALADAYIASFESKYFYNFWRPITAIREADTDGNFETTGDSDWNSYLTAPAIPDWPSAHATGGGAAAEVLAGFFGTDFIEFNMTSGPPYAGTTRWFSSFSEAALENANSRALAGIHFREATVAGLAQGQRIGTWVFANHLRPMR